MSRTKDDEPHRPCPRPFFWWFRETGFEWACPNCEKVWLIRNNPSQLVGGRVLWPKHIPSGTYRTPYAQMACRGLQRPTAQRGRDPWASLEGREILTRMHTTFPTLAAEVERGRARDGSDEDDTPTPLHAHEVTADDAAAIRGLSGAEFADEVRVALPSGKSISGAEMRKWIRGQG